MGSARQRTAVLFGLSLALCVGAAVSPGAARAQASRSLPSPYRLSLDAGWRVTVSHQGSWYRQLREAGFERRTQGPSLALSLAGYPREGVVLGARAEWEHGRGDLRGRGDLDGNASYRLQRISGTLFTGPSLHPSLSYGRWMELAAELGLGMVTDRYRLRGEVDSSYAMRFEVALVIGWAWRHGGFGFRTALSRSFFGHIGPQDLSTDVATVHLQLRGDIRW